MLVLVAPLDVFSLAERPALVEHLWSISGNLPTFLLNSPVAEAHYVNATELYPDLHLVVLEDGEAVGRLHAVPVPRRELHDLPQRGWDWALESSVDQPTDDRSQVSLLEAHIAVAHRGRGLSSLLLATAREKFRRLGTTDLLGPVRPTAKAEEPRTPITDYAARVRADGLPTDPWMRVHARLGGRILSVALLSMTIPGTLSQWREWTGLPFDTDGLTDVEGALVPVLVDTAQEHAVYVEPNVWVHHAL
jgi:GNAT superfamily N-acetyltransferase